MTFSKHSNPWRKIALMSAILGLPGAAMADWGLNLTRGVTPYSNTVYDLHMLILGVCVFVGIVVFALILYSVVVFRKSAGAKAAQWPTVFARRACPAD